MRTENRQAEAILEENPLNKAALDYTIGTLLLSKDLLAIKTFVERFSRTEVLPALPEPLQQAVISYAEHDPEYCRKYGVTDKVLSEFSIFKQRVLGLRPTKSSDWNSRLSTYFLVLFDTL